MNNTRTQCNIFSLSLDLLRWTYSKDHLPYGILGKQTKVGQSWEGKYRSKRQWYRQQWNGEGWCWSQRERRRFWSQKVISLISRFKLSISIPQRCSEESNADDIGGRAKSVSNVHKLLSARYAALGPLSFKEKQVRWFCDILKVNYGCISIGVWFDSCWLYIFWPRLGQNMGNTHTQSEDKFNSSFNV